MFGQVFLLEGVGDYKQVIDLSSPTPSNLLKPVGTRSNTFRPVETRSDLLKHVPPPPLPPERTTKVL